MIAFEIVHLVTLQSHYANELVFKDLLRKQFEPCEVIGRRGSTFRALDIDGLEENQQ